MSDRVTDYKYVVRLPADLGEALKERAHRQDTPISRVVRAALVNYLYGNGQPPVRPIRAVVNNGNGQTE